MKIHYTEEIFCMCRGLRKTLKEKMCKRNKRIFLGFCSTQAFHDTVRRKLCHIQITILMSLIGEWNKVPHLLYIVKSFNSSNKILEILVSSFTSVLSALIQLWQSNSLRERRGFVVITDVNSICTSDPQSYLLQGQNRLFSNWLFHLLI